MTKSCCGCSTTSYVDNVSCDTVLACVMLLLLLNNDNFPLGQDDISWCTFSRSGMGWERTHLLLALGTLPLTTHPLRDGGGRGSSLGGHSPQAYTWYAVRHCSYCCSTSH